MRKILFLFITILLLQTSCITPVMMDVNNPFDHEYDWNLTLIVWYGDPEMWHQMQKNTPLLNIINTDPLFKDYEMKKFENTADEYIKKANENGGVDNTTVVVIKL